MIDGIGYGKSMSYISKRSSVGREKKLHAVDAICAYSIKGRPKALGRLGVNVFVQM